jgi:sterol 3beta-glucosyltransferase
VQPFLALGVGLRKAGHEVAVLTCPRFESMVLRQGLPFHRLDEGLLELLDTQQGRAMIGKISSVVGALRILPGVLRQIGPLHRRIVSDAWDAVQAFAPDLIVHSTKVFCMPAFAAKLDIGCMHVLFYPFMVPTATEPMAGLPRLRLGGSYNRATYRLVAGLARLGASPYLSNWRRQFDPEGLSRDSGPLRISAKRPLPILHAASPSLCPPPPDWPAHAVTTGYWFMPEDATAPAIDDEAPAALQEFLAAGPAPVYIGFGSMAGVDPERTTRIVIEAVERAGVRAVVSTGWGGLLRDAEQIRLERVFPVDAVSHDWLFPRVSAVVHHGGAGTTTAGLRAGRPTLICPFGVDQPWWGRKVAALGVGPAPIAQKLLTVERLADALVEITHNESMRAAAARIAAAMQHERGVAAAIEFIHRWRES